MTVGDQNDSELLAEIAFSKSHVAFQELVRRHGGMVIAVCRRMLDDVHDADDAAQAVFLVLWQQVGKLRGRASVAGWLHHVARNVCRNAKRTRSVRQQREREAAEMNTNTAKEIDVWHDIKELLDEELNRLPEKYRLPIILFHLEGRSLEEIAVLLATKASTIGTRLSRARELLASRLVRRGVAVSGSVLSTTLANNAGAAIVPATFASTTVQAASLLATGKLAAGGALSATSAALAKGTIRTMSLTKLKLVAFATLAVVAVVSGGAMIVNLAYGMSAEQRAEVARLEGTWTVVGMERGGQPLPEDQYKPLNSRWIFDGSNLSRKQLLPDGKEVSEDLTIRLDPTALPKTMDASQLGKTVLGIYELKGNTLVVCVDRRGPRPTQLKTQANSSITLYTLERAK